MRELSLNNCRLDKRYDIRQQLGRGSYAEIYLARDVIASPQSAHSSVVIKALNVFLQNDLDEDLERTLVENFQNEAIALDRVRHPNIISRLGHGTARDLNGTVFHYLVLEYMPGGDMQRLLRQGRIPLAKSLDYIEQVCSGLGHAHAHGVIHRDVKPQNLLLTSDHQTVKIADFGVARFSHSDSPITRVGTNIYAPPEHSPLLANDSEVVTIAKLTPAADIYSLAKSVYAIITSESPRYYANQPITQLPLDVRGEKWSGQLLHILEKATQNDPAARYQSIDEFWQQLAELKRTALAGTSTSKPFPVAGGPQAHVAPGYSPIAPAEPKFNTSRDLKIRFPAIMPDARKTTEMSADQHAANIDEFGWPRNEPLIPAVSNGQSNIPDRPAVYDPTPRKKRRFLRKAVSFVVFIGLFAGLLYGTHAYLRGSGLLPEISNPFSQHTATANTDIYLRPSPNTNNDPVGLVTKNSKVRIVNSQNNWYQVDVIEQGRSRANQAAVSRGWLNGKYLDMD